MGERAGGAGVTDAGGSPTGAVSVGAAVADGVGGNVVPVGTGTAADGHGDALAVADEDTAIADTRAAGVAAARRVALTVGRGAC